MDKCFQCGKAIITISTEEEYVNESLVVITKYVCSDSSCQKRIESKERERVRLQKEINTDKEARTKENMYNRKRGAELVFKTNAARH